MSAPSILKDYVNRTGSVEGALKSYVGAGAAADDSGYGSKVLTEYKRLKQVASGKNVPIYFPPASAPAPSTTLAQKSLGAPGQAGQHRSRRGPRRQRERRDSRRPLSPTLSWSKATVGESWRWLSFWLAPLALPGTACFAAGIACFAWYRLPSLFAPAKAGAQFCCRCRYIGRYGSGNIPWVPAFAGTTFQFYCRCRYIGRYGSGDTLAVPAFAGTTFLFYRRCRHIGRYGSGNTPWVPAFAESTLYRSYIK
ncbi:hypothetical protein [Massilia phosphatilytica]